MQISVIYGALFYCLLDLYLMRMERPKRWQRPPSVSSAQYFAIVCKKISWADVICFAAMSVLKYARNIQRRPAVEKKRLQNTLEYTTYYF